MTINEIKKALYKEKPTAFLTRLSGLTDSNSIYNYKALISENREVIFHIPRQEMGDEVFDREVPAQLLIRWISAYGKR